MVENPLHRSEDSAAESASAVISVDDLAKHFREVAAVDGVSFSVRRGETVALLGGNGAGKTTTISMLLGLLKPTRGTIRLFGLDLARYRHRVLGRMNFSSPYVDLPHRLTLRQNLMVFAKLYGLGDARARIAELAKALELDALLDRRVGSHSAGQKTRGALAKALIKYETLESSDVDRIMRGDMITRPSVSDMLDAPPSQPRRGVVIQPPSSPDLPPGAMPAPG